MRVPATAGLRRANKRRRAPAPPSEHLGSSALMTAQSPGSWFSKSLVLAVAYAAMLE